MNTNKSTEAIKIISFAIILTMAVLISAFNTNTYVQAFTALSDTNNAEETLAKSSEEAICGIFIASVCNINFPTKPGLSADTLRAELDDIVSTCESVGINAIYFQVRPTADALYKSKIFPTSEYLTGKQGAPFQDGFDPLEYLLTAAHEKNITVHAWVNPLRVTTGTAAAPRHNITILAENHPARINPDYAIAYADGKLYFDCGNPDVRTLIAQSVAEIVTNYSVDGVIFDDYFYPYPVTDSDGKIAAFDDSDSFTKYGSGMTLEDWRRDNINKMVEACYTAIKSVRADCEFGVAPFGIWQNDNGANGGSQTAGLESYSAIYCDPTAWICGGYIDYIAPQIYWQFTNTTAPYATLVRWWNDAVSDSGVELLISHGVYNYDTWNNPENELKNQIDFAKSFAAYRGSILYGYAALKANSNGLFEEAREVFAENKTAVEASANILD